MEDKYKPIPITGKKGEEAIEANVAGLVLIKKKFDKDGNLKDVNVTFTPNAHLDILYNGGEISVVRTVGV